MYTEQTNVNMEILIVCMSTVVKLHQCLYRVVKEIQELQDTMVMLDTPVSKDLKVRRGLRERKELVEKLETLVTLDWMDPKD